MKKLTLKGFFAISRKKFLDVGARLKLLSWKLQAFMNAFKKWLRLSPKKTRLSHDVLILEHHFKLMLISKQEFCDESKILRRL